MKVYKDTFKIIFDFDYAKVAGLSQANVKGQTVNMSNEVVVNHPSLEGHLGYTNGRLSERAFTKTDRAGYRGFWYEEWATVIHEAVHCWVGKVLLKQETRIIGDTPKVYAHHRVFYVAEEIITFGLEVEYNRRQGKVVDNRVFEEFMTMTYNEQEIDCIIEIAMQFIGEVVNQIFDWRYR